MLVVNSLTRRRVLAGTAAAAGVLTGLPRTALAVDRPLNATLSVAMGIASGTLAHNTDPYGYITQFAFSGSILKADITVRDPRAPSQALHVVGVLSSLEVVPGKLADLRAGFIMSEVNKKLIEQVSGAKGFVMQPSYFNFITMKYDWAVKPARWFVQAAPSTALAGQIRPLEAGGLGFSSSPEPDAVISGPRCFDGHLAMSSAYPGKSGFPVTLDAQRSAYTLIW